LVLQEDLPPPAPAPAPAPPRPPLPSSGELVRAPIQMVPVRFESEGEQRLALYVRSSTAMFQEVGVSPRVAEIERSTHKLALSPLDRRPVYQEGLITVRYPALLRGRYTSRADTRTAGWVILGAGALVTTISPFVGRGGASSEAEFDGPLFGALLIG